MSSEELFLEMSVGDHDSAAVIVAGEHADGRQYEFIHSSVSPTRVVGELRFSPAVRPGTVETPAFITITGTDWKSGTAEVCISTDEQTQDSIHLAVPDNSTISNRGIESWKVQMLSAPVYYAVVQICQENITAALDVLTQQYSRDAIGWQFRGDCRDTLCFDAFVDVLDNLAEKDVDSMFSHVQFRSAITYFAKRLCDTPPQGIHSFDQLQRRVQQWNDALNLKPLTVPEVLGDKLGRQWYRGELSTERDDLHTIGFDPEAYDETWETVMPACWIGHAVLTDGVDAAKAYVHNRPVPCTGQYNILRTQANEAGRGERGPAWAAVLTHALTAPDGDFRHDAYWYLRLTGKDYRGKGKFTPLLFAGATALAPRYMPAFKIQKTEFEEKYATGHVWRRDQAVQKEADAFGAAKRIAEGKTNNAYDMIPWMVAKAERNLAHAEAKVADRTGQPGEFVARYEEGIAEITRLAHKYNLFASSVDGHLQFLQGKLVDAKQHVGEGDSDQ